MTTAKASTKTKSAPKKSKPSTDKTESRTKTAKEMKKLEEKIQGLEEELIRVRDERAAAEDKMMRVVAEYENAKRRKERDADRALQFAKDRLIMNLLPLVDNVRRSAAYEAEHQGQESHQEGMRIIFDQMKKFLKETADVESFEPLGEAFNPEEHEAMMVRSEEDKEAGIILEVFECGYRSGDRVLRPAKVVVSE